MSLSKEEESEVNNYIQSAQDIIKQIEESQQYKFLTFCCHPLIGMPIAYTLSRVLRRIGDTEKLAVMLEAWGGDIDVAYKILKMLKSYTQHLTIIVPFFAKSAASLIAIGGNELIMCKGSELGPIDPQVFDHSSGEFVPAHSIKEAITFIEEINDGPMKISLAEKIAPLLIGAYREAGQSSKQYLEEILNELGDKKHPAIEAFTEKFLSHQYPIDRDFLKAIGIKVTYPDKELENLLSDLYEIYGDLTSDIYLRHPGELLLIQSNNMKHMQFSGKEMMWKIDGIGKYKSNISNKNESKEII